MPETPTSSHLVPTSSRKAGRRHPATSSHRPPPYGDEVALTRPGTTTDGLFPARPRDEVTGRGQTIHRSAHISDDGRYRYTLTRDWCEPEQTPLWVTFVMLNPSTADGNQDDPTIRRCIGFARALGGTGLIVVNLYALRATQPADLWTVDDPVGPWNDLTLELYLGMASRHDFPIIAAWGANARPDRVHALLAMTGSERLTALGVTLAGAPKHPLARGHHRIPDDAVPQPWPGAA